MPGSIVVPADGVATTTVELYRLTDDVVDVMLRLLRRRRDFDVAFLPMDPLADDPGASEDDEKNSGWTLGHLIAHVTASAEESAAVAAELARGVPYHGRSRREVPWREIATVAQCRARLHECRRICLAGLAMWPDSTGPRQYVCSLGGQPARGRDRTLPVGTAPRRWASRADARHADPGARRSQKPQHVGTVAWALHEEAFASDTRADRRAARMNLPRVR